MFRIKCPVCGVKFSSYLMGLLRPTYGSVNCSDCYSRLELLNPGRCHFLTGIIFALALIWFVLSEVSYLWLWMTLAGIACWLLNPLIVGLFGKWGPWSYRAEDAAKVQLLGATQAVSTILAGIWVCYMAKVLLLPYYQLVSNFDFADQQITEAIEHYKGLFGGRGVIGLIIGFISVSTLTTTSVLRGGLRKRAIESKLSEADTQQ